MAIAKVHLVDGTYELFRQYYGAPKRSALEGREVGATLGLLRTLLSLLRQEDVTHVAVAFDTVVESFRNELFDGYKTGDGIEPALKEQFPLAERAAAALGLVVWPMARYEADDALATAAHRWRGEVRQVVLCSPDKDLAQCVHGREVICLDRRRGVEIDEEEVIARHGVPPRSIPDYLALVGDAADGIPGLKGWGAKSAAVVLAHYGHLEKIPPHEEDWQASPRGAARLAATLRQEREAALLYRDLATLRTEVPLPEELGDLRWQGSRGEELAALCTELGDSRIPGLLPPSPTG